jgi:hypothetical protein
VGPAAIEAGVGEAAAADDAGGEADRHAVASSTTVQAQRIIDRFMRAKIAGRVCCENGPAVTFACVSEGHATGQ